MEGLLQHLNFSFPVIQPWLMKGGASMFRQTLINVTLLAELLLYIMPRSQSFKHDALWELQFLGEDV